MEKLIKLIIYILIISIFLTMGLFTAFQWRINKIDRKLTCIHSRINALPFFVVPELRTDRVAIQQQIDFIKLSCDKSYIF